MVGRKGVFGAGPVRILVLGLAAALAAVGCGKRKVVYLEDDLPLAAPVEGASPGAAGSELDDPPGRVARVSVVSGAVSVDPAGQETWAPALLNLPLQGGDALWSAPGARAELQVGTTGLRAGEATGLSLLRVTDGFCQVGLDQGSLMVHIRPGAFPDSVEVDTPAGAVNFADPGTYRLDMDPARADLAVTVRAGQARVTLEGEVLPVAPGQRLQVASGAEPSYGVDAAQVPDDLELWSDARDEAAEASPSARRLPAGIMGAQDLDGAGAWKQDEKLGSLWFPAAAPGWAPYRAGRWTWVDPWGWTWVDDAPWGFATSHYGRWASVGGAWAWAPGPVSARPVYAPALVAFVGQAPGTRNPVPGASGGVAWFPLGPRDAYHPAYPASRAYLARINAAQPGTAAGAAWANAKVPGALTVVPRETFTTFAPVAGAALPADGAKLLGTRPPLGGAPALAPTARSLPRGAAPVPPHPFARPLVARSPLPAGPAPIATRAAAVAGNHGRPLGTVAPVIRSAPPRPWRNAESRTGPLPLRNRVQAPPAPRPAEGASRDQPAGSAAQGARPGARRPGAKAHPPRAGGRRMAPQGPGGRARGARPPAGRPRGPRARPGQGRGRGQERAPEGREGRRR